MKTFLSGTLICICVFLVFGAFFAFSQAEFLLGLYLLVLAIISLCLRAMVIASYTIKERKLIDAFTSIAELGNDSAMYDLYVYYLTNNLLALNPKNLATYWLNQVAKAGNEEAKKRLEEMNSSQEEGTSLGQE